MIPEGRGARSVKSETGAERRLRVRQEAAKRLLAWGFTPASVAGMLGCSPESINDIGATQPSECNHDTNGPHS